jgi:predicted MFS family arabinose efflux permease
LEVWHACALLIVHGIAGVLWNPPSQVLLHDIVGPELLQSAVRLNATARYLGLLVGPAVGGGILLLFGRPDYAILFNAALYLPTILWLWKAPYGPRFRQGRAAPARAIRGLADVTDTIKRVRGHHVIASMTLLAGFASFFVGNAYQAQMPEFAQDLGRIDPDLSYSILLAADAAGALIAAMILESRGLLAPNPRTACVLALLWCCSLGGFAMASSYPVALTLLFCAGFVELSFSSMAQTLVQLNAPPDIRGRVIGVYSMSALGMRMVSGITVGIVGGIIGIHFSLAFSAMALALVIVVLLMLLRSGASNIALRTNGQS